MQSIVSFLIFLCHKITGSIKWGWFLVAQRLKRLPARRETRVQSLGQEDPLEKEMAPHSSILARRIPWTEEPGGLQSTGSQRVGHDWATSLTHSLIQSKGSLWRLKELVQIKLYNLCAWKIISPKLSNVVLEVSILHRSLINSSLWERFQLALF